MIDPTAIAVLLAPVQGPKSPSLPRDFMAGATSEEILGFWDIAPLKNVPNLQIKTDAKKYKWFDFASVESFSPIMSRRMFDFLHAMHPFKHQLYPVDVVSAATGELIPPPAEDRSYILVQVLEVLDVLNAEQSTWRPSPIDPKEIGSVDRMVINLPKGGLPPVFRLTVLRGIGLFANKAAYAALHAARFTGVAASQVVYAAATAPKPTFWQRLFRRGKGK